MQQILDIFVQDKIQNCKNVQFFPTIRMWYYTKCTEKDKFILSVIWYIQITKYLREEFSR